VKHQLLRSNLCTQCYVYVQCGRIKCTLESTFLNSCEIYQKPRLLPTLQLFLYREFSPLIFSSTGWRFAMWNMRQVNISWNLRCDCHNYPRRIIQDRLNMSRILQYILCFGSQGIQYDALHQCSSHVRALYPTN
jgi:hypothetical protein